MQFGCLLSPYDSRDYKLKAGVVAHGLPEAYSCPLKVKVKDQGNVSSCVAHAVSSILEYHAVTPISLSTNFIYGIQKKLFDRDGKGMYLRDACKIVTDYGDMLLSDCQGNDEVPESYEKAEEAFNDTSKLEKAYKYHILKYFSCANIEEIKHALYNYGPVLGSIKWYNNYKVDKDGVLYGDQIGDYGYHAIMIYGYTPYGFWCQNSWGKAWGKDGRFFVPNLVGFSEARGFVDWEDCDELKEPDPKGFVELLYKLFNKTVNLLKKVFKK